MLRELELGRLDRVRSLFRGFDYSLSIQATIEGNNPGRVFVDDIYEPRAALALTVEGYLLAGDTGNAETNAALARLFRESIFTGDVSVNDDEAMELAVHPKTWESKLHELIPTHKAERIERYHYVCRSVKLDWRKHVPVGYTVQRVDRTLLQDAQVVFPDVVGEWMNLEEMWGTLENFLFKGISFAILREREVVAWCTPDCVAGDQIDVGIVTHPAHRRRGLAAVAAAATVEYCLSHGFNAIGWHCNTNNIGSWKTAEKVGFERNREYVYYYYIYNLAAHLAELGWYHYQRGEYAETVRYYEQAFALQGKRPGYHYHLVASAYAHLGNTEKALKYLLTALDYGWTNIEWTKQQAEFGILHSTPEWNAIWRE
jgi:RimJ/RimL family protein N-acetyltransferase